MLDKTLMLSVGHDMFVQASACAVGIPPADLSALMAPPGLARRKVRLLQAKSFQQAQHILEDMEKLRGPGESTNIRLRDCSLSWTSAATSCCAPIAEPRPTALGRFRAAGHDQGGAGLLQLRLELHLAAQVHHVTHVHHQFDGRHRGADGP